MKQSTTICHAGKSDLLAAAHLAFFGQQHIQRGISGSNDRIIGVHGLLHVFQHGLVNTPLAAENPDLVPQIMAFYIDLFHILLGYLVLLAALLQQQVDCLIFTLQAQPPVNAVLIKQHNRINQQQGKIIGAAGIAAIAGIAVQQQAGQQHQNPVWENRPAVDALQNRGIHLADQQPVQQ